MPNTVTYKGPADPSDPSVAYEVDGHTFRLDQKVEDVPDAVAKKLAAAEGHEFTVTKQDSSGSKS